MIIDGNHPSCPDKFQAPVVIIGGGAAGLTVALRLEARGQACLLLEAGDETLSAAQQELYRAASISPAAHGPVHLYRRRGLGGSTAIWGGRCIPFDPIDFEHRDWLPHASWPVCYADVQKYYEDAASICRAGPALFDAEEALPGSPPSIIAGFKDPDVILDRIERFSEPTHFGRHYRKRLSSSLLITVVKNVTAVEILTTDSGQAATGVRAKTLGNRVLHVAGEKVILAAGALEVARLLLASNKQRPGGLGNDRDLVGRFYQSHFEGEVGSVQFENTPGNANIDYERSAEGIYCRRYIWLSPHAQRIHKLAGLILRPHHQKISDPCHGDPILSSMFLVKDLLLPEYGRRMNSTESAAAENLRDGNRFLHARHMVNVVLGAPRMAAFAVDWVRRRNLARRKLPSVVLKSPTGHYTLDVNAEQTPNCNSRVSLSSELDALGLPKLKIDWRESGQDREMVTRGLHLIQQAFAKQRGAKVILNPAVLPAEVASLTRIGGHHIGTARMASCAEHGVVDSNGEVFGTKGLYVAGAAVFPTSGFANPTFLLVALALRLADHLIERTSVAQVG